MPGDEHRLRGRLTLVAGLTLVWQLLAAPAAHASGPCDSTLFRVGVPYADVACNTVAAAHVVGKTVDFATDPLGYIANMISTAVSSLLSMIFKALESTTTIDWTNPGFIRTYTMAFGASTVLTVILWLLAVAKRAMHGINPAQALGESIGFLLMSVAVSAFAPAVLFYVVQLFDEAADAMLAPAFGDIGRMAIPIAAALEVLMDIPGGDVFVIFLGGCLLTAVAGVWLELIVRSALILAGLVFGPVVFSGLVDRALWDHSKRWLGVMLGVIGSKFVTFTIIALATGMLSNVGKSPDTVQAFATVFTALALFVLAFFLPFQIAKFLPLFGDELAGIRQARDEVKGRGQQALGPLGNTYDELKSRLTGGGAAAEAPEPSDSDPAGAGPTDMPGGPPSAGRRPQEPSGPGSEAPGTSAPASTGRPGDMPPPGNTSDKGGTAGGSSPGGTTGPTETPPPAPAPRPDSQPPPAAGPVWPPPEPA